jgi:hypothetical protein
MRFATDISGTWMRWQKLLEVSLLPQHPSSSLFNAAKHLFFAAAFGRNHFKP